MRATLSFVKEKFDEFNALCFEGSLPRVPLRISSSRRTLGCLKYRRSGSLSGGSRFCDFSIWISDRLDLPQAVVEDTLIHEMIHLQILSRGLKDSSAHGGLFRAWMQRINTRHGRNISVSHRSSSEEHATDRARRGHYICLSRFRDGETLLTLAARTRIFELHRRLEQMPDVVEFEWRYSESPLFNRIPRSRSLKFYRIPDELREPLRQSLRCLCDGRTFRPAPMGS